MNKIMLKQQIKKLKGLAAGNSNTHEAAAALKKIQEFEALLSAKATRGIFEKVPGSGTWWIRYVDGGGKYRRERVGAYGLAEQLLSTRRGDAVRGVKLPETLRRRIVSFSEIADDAIDYIKAEYSRPATETQRMAVLKDHFTGAADAITPKLCKSVLDTLTREKRWSASTRNHHHNLVSLAFRLAIENDKVRDNPARGFQRAQENNSRVRYLTPSEEKSLREVMRANPAWADHDADLTLALSTGLRMSNMYCNLVWENVDLVGRTAVIENTKNGDRVVCPLNDDAMRALAVFRARGDGTGRVVRNSKGATLSYTAFWFVPALQAAKIKNFHWHDLRHTYASRLRQAGVPLGNIAELLGHRGLAMTRRYAHLAISNLHEAVARIATTNSTPVAPTTTSETELFSYLN